MFHIIHEVFIRNGNGEIDHMRTLIDCGATSIFMAPRLRTWLGLADKPVYVTILDLDGQVMARVSDSRKTAFTVQYMEHSSLVHELEVLVVPMRADDLVLGLPRFQSRNPDIDWQSGWLLALRTTGKSEVVAVNPVDHQKCPGNVPGSTTREEACSEGVGGIPDIHILGASAFDDLLASEQVVGTFFLGVGDCTGLLGATVEDITDGEWDRPQALDGRAGSSGGSCGSRASTWEPSMTATGTPRHEGSTVRRVLALPLENCFTSRLLDIPPYRSLYIYYKLRTNVCRWSWHNDRDGAYRRWRTYPGYLWGFCGGCQ